MESDDCSVPSEDEDNGGQYSRAECSEETSYVSQHTLQPSIQDGQCSESEYRSVIPNKRIGGEYSSNCASNKIRGESVEQSGSKPPRECAIGSSGRLDHSRLPSEPSKKARRRPVDGDIGSCSNQERDDGRSDIEPRTMPSEHSGREHSGPAPSEPSCNINHGKDGENRDCLEDPLVKRKVRVGDLASLLAGAQSKAG